MMSRVFSGLAIGNVLVIAGAGALGLLSPDDSPDRHVLLSVFALLVCAFVQVLTFTYFTVTGKIVLQSVHLAGYDSDAAVEVTRIKRSMSYHLLAVMLGALVLTVSGAAHWRTGVSSTIHVLTAVGFLPLLCAVFAGEYGLIIRNRRVVDAATRAYEDWRRGRVKSKVGVEE